MGEPIKHKDESEVKEYISTPKKPEPPDGGYGWVVCFAVFLCNLLSHGPLYCFGILFEPIANEFKSNHTAVAFVGSIMVCFKFSAPIFASPFIDRYGCQYLARFASMLSVAGFAMSAISPNLLFVGIGYGMMGGMGLGVSFLSSIVQCNEYFEKRRSIAIGIAMCGSSLSILIMGPWTNYILDVYGWRIVVWSYVSFNLICYALGLLLRPLTPIQENEHKMENGNGLQEQQSSVPLVPYEDLSETPSHSTSLHPIPVTVHTNGSHKIHEKGLKSSDKHMTEGIRRHASKFKNATVLAFQPIYQPLFKIWILHKLFVYFALFTPFTFLPNMIIHRNKTAEHHMYRQDIGTIISLIGGGDAIGRLFCGFACDYYGINALNVTSAICVIAAVSILVMVWSHSFLIYAICGWFYGLAIGPIASLSSPILVKLFGIGSLAPNYSLVLFFQGLYTIPGVVLGGYFFEFTQSYQLTFTVTSFSFLVGGALSHLTNTLHNRGNNNS